MARWWGSPPTATPRTPLLPLSCRADGCFPGLCPPRGQGARCALHWVQALRRLRRIARARPLAGAQARLQPTGGTRRPHNCPPPGGSAPPPAELACCPPPCVPAGCLCAPPHRPRGCSPRERGGPGRQHRGERFEVDGAAPLLCVAPAARQPVCSRTLVAAWSSRWCPPLLRPRTCSCSRGVRSGPRAGAPALARRPTASRVPSCCRSSSARTCLWSWRRLACP